MTAPDPGFVDPLDDTDKAAIRRLAAEELVDRHGMTLKQAEAMQDRIRKLTTPKPSEEEHQ
ncbi:hypothetical protein [Rhodococcus erythropolis]|uniref:hypothetical protein n=1 Tax=Rhodococcus erythropolis TaxID=1833 RepID=UPI0036DE2635